jgi:hypothetical protein
MGDRAANQHRAAGKEREHRFNGHAQERQAECCGGPERDIC